MVEDINQWKNDLLQDILALEKSIRVLEVELGITASALERFDASAVRTGAGITQNLSPEISKPTTGGNVLSIHAESSEVIPQNYLPAEESTQLSQNSFVEAVKASLARQNKIPVGTAVGQSQNVKPQAKLAPLQPAQKPQGSPSLVINVTPKAPPQEETHLPSYGPKDIPQLALLIKKVNELIVLNSEIASDLSEILSSTRNLNSSSRIHSLLDRLARISING